MIEPTQLVGSKVLVGVTREHVSGEVSQEQFAGVAQIEDQGDYRIVKLQCTDGEARDHPFDLRSIVKAEPGEYRLASTGEIIRDPDFLMTWTVTEGQPEE